MKTKNLIFFLTVMVMGSVPVQTAFAQTGELPQYTKAKALFEQASMPTEEEIRQLAGVYVARRCVFPTNYEANIAVSIANSQYDEGREGFVVLHHSYRLNIGPTLRYNLSQVKVPGLLRFIQDVPLGLTLSWSSQRIQDETGIVPLVAFRGLYPLRVKSLSFTQGSYVAEVDQIVRGRAEPSSSSLRVDRQAQVFLTTLTVGSVTRYCYDFAKVVSREELPQEMQ